MKEVAKFVLMARENAGSPCRWSTTKPDGMFKKKCNGDGYYEGSENTDLKFISPLLLGFGGLHTPILSLKAFTASGWRTTNLCEELLSASYSAVLHGEAPRFQSAGAP